MEKRHVALGGALLLIGAVIVAIQVFVRPPAPSFGVDAPVAGSPAAGGRRGNHPAAPDFADIDRWLNSEPLTMAGLQGKVVVVDFWTYSCINCLRTLPHLREWHEKYAGKGLVIVGVHSPEFEFEKMEVNVREAMARERVTWPVAMDNDFGTWRAYSNRYWPHKFLVDKDGAIRYDHVGEGAYEETERRIRELLAEAGADVAAIPVGARKPEGAAFGVTRELYAGLAWASGGYIGNLPKNSPGLQNFEDGGSHKEGRVYLHGLWEMTDEYARHGRTTEGFEDYALIAYRAGSVNVVVRPTGSEPFNLMATLNGRPIPEDSRGADVRVDEEGRTYVQVDSPRLYSVVRSPEMTTAELKLAANSPDFLLYTYTFGV